MYSVLIIASCDSIYCINYKCTFYQINERRFSLILLPLFSWYQSSEFLSIPMTHDFLFDMASIIDSSSLFKAITNLFSPYYIHSGDHLKSPLVQPLPHGDNYPSWRLSMHMLLMPRTNYILFSGL